jgi:hypothetical protein
MWDLAWQASPGSMSRCRGLHRDSDPWEEGYRQPRLFRHLGSHRIGRVRMDRAVSVGLCDGHSFRLTPTIRRHGRTGWLSGDPARLAPSPRPRGGIPEMTPIDFSYQLHCAQGLD